MSRVVDYKPGEWSLVALDDGTQVMVSIGQTSLWIYVPRHRFPPRFLLRRFPHLGAKKTLLLVASVRKADGDVALFREEDGTPLEFGRTLLEVVTEELQKYAKLQDTGDFFAELGMHLNTQLPSWLCFPPSFFKELESLSPDERDRRMLQRSRELGLLSDE